MSGSWKYNNEPNQSYGWWKNSGEQGKVEKILSNVGIIFFTSEANAREFAEKLMNKTGARLNDSFGDQRIYAGVNGKSAFSHPPLTKRVYINDVSLLDVLGVLKSDFGVPSNVIADLTSRNNLNKPGTDVSNGGNRKNLGSNGQKI